MSLPGYDDWKCDEEWSYWDDEPRPVCLRCHGRYSSPTAPYCGPCFKVIDDQIRAGFNPHEAPFARNNKGDEMGRYASDPGGGDFELPEPGTYSARCYRVIDLGTQHNEKWNTNKEQVMIGWELVGTKMAEDDRPFVMHKTYTNSLHQKAQLRKDLEAWRGLAFKDEELKGFDLAALVGKPCLISVIHTDRNGSTYANVNGVMSVPKGQTVPDLANDPVTFFLDEPDWDVFKALSEKMQQRISASPEYQRELTGGEPPPTEEERPPLPDDQECPF